MMTIKVGIIGCGIANGKHMPSLQKVENVEMTAFCDVTFRKQRVRQKHTVLTMQRFMMITNIVKR